MAFSLAESLLGRILFRIEGKWKGRGRLPILLSDDRIARRKPPDPETKTGRRRLVDGTVSAREAPSRRSPWIAALSGPPPVC
jgi:hypothetical protein